MSTLTAQFRPYEQFHIDSVKVDGLSTGQVGSALALLAKKGMVQHGALRGYYCLPNGGQVEDSEIIVIDNLLTAMAAAEPVLRKHKKVIALLREVR